MKVRFTISELAIAVSVALFLVTVVGQMVKICSVARPGSSELASKTTLYSSFCPANWQMFKVGRVGQSHNLLQFRPAGMQHCWKNY